MVFWFLVVYASILCFFNEYYDGSREMNERASHIERDTLDVIIYILTFTSDCSFFLSFFLSLFPSHILFTHTDKRKQISRSSLTTNPPH